MSKTKFLERFENTGLNVPDHVWHKAIDNDIDNRRYQVFKSNRVTSEQLDKELSREDSITTLTLLRHPNLSNSAINDAVNHLDASRRVYVAKNINLNTEQLDKLLNDSDHDVIAQAAGNHNLTKEQLDRVLNHVNHHVRFVGRFNPNYDKYFPDGH